MNIFCCFYEFCSIWQRGDSLRDAAILFYINSDFWFSLWSLYIDYNVYSIVVVISIFKISKTNWLLKTRFESMRSILLPLSSRSVKYTGNTNWSMSCRVHISLTSAFSICKDIAIYREVINTFSWITFLMIYHHFISC